MQVWKTGCFRTRTDCIKGLKVNKTIRRHCIEISNKRGRKSNPVWRSDYTAPRWIRKCERQTCCSETGKEVDKTVEIELWNSDDDTRQLADRAKKAKLSVGKFVTILANKTKNSKLYAVNFKYSGRYQFKERNGHGECNVFIGPLGNVAERDNQVSTSIPVTENGVTIWYPIVFYNDEADEATGRKRNMLADAAKKCFIERNEHRPKIAVVTGPNRPYIDREGAQRLSYKAFRFEMLPKEGYKSE